MTGGSARQVASGRWARRLLVLVGRRAGLLLVVLAAVYVGVDLLPGSAVESALGRDASPEQILARERELGLDRPVLVQFVDWLGGLVTGDLGTTVRGTPVAEVVGARFPNTLLITGLALVFTIVGAIGIGVLWTMRPGGVLDRLLGWSTTAAIAVPEFVVATVLVAVFALGVQWLPAVTTTGPDGAPASASMLVLPVLALALPQTGWNLRVTRAALAEAYTTPHVQAAVLDGIAPARILLRHALPVAAPTIAMSLATTVGMLLGGALVVETVFNHPGIGAVLAGSVAGRDTIVVTSVVAIVGAAITVVLVAADLLRAWSIRGRA